ncbi:snRNA-activating protein complex subunit 3 [Camponotus floridanus]|nr:snRNA-activating protein complex subunit 3 [Camponotus floridanus]XP_011253399.1 snRNA-activating protein complex subunit 3 [Camponotus floridanus]XP_011253400.1 snRNA-activating protein complex subunit 3 [Camponotus floridanus]XP_011253402.1 snRNA-activating protein complex subunit 3 [Camponotus floridanus]
MDQIYKIYSHQASPKICLKNYFQQYSELLNSFLCHNLNEQSDEKIFQLMDVDLPQARTLLIKHYCSIDNLSPLMEPNTTEKEKQENTKSEQKLNNVPLETIKVLKTLSKETLLKPRFQDGIPIKYDESSYSNNNSVIPYKEFLIYCRVYEPFEYQNRPYKLKAPVVNLKSVISILGCQTLYELRQKIICQSDLSITTDTSNKSNRHKIGALAKDVYKSGFFYIEDTFYNDTSVETNIDYSRVILEWAATRDLGPFKVATMDAQINSLCARFGFPWVYVHQGCCEHLIVLTDARLVTENDVLSLTAYPRIEKIRPVVGKNCISCGIFNVHWILTEHNRIPHDISYFCNKCFISYNYVDGKKIGNFKAYNYPCIPELMFVKKRTATSRE